MQKELLFIDFYEIFDLSELHKIPILRILYDKYIPKDAISANGMPVIIYQEKKQNFVIYY